MEVFPRNSACDSLLYYMYNSLKAKTALVNADSWSRGASSQRCGCLRAIEGTTSFALLSATRPQDLQWNTLAVFTINTLCGTPPAE